MLNEIKYRIAIQDEFNKSIESLYSNRLKKCYEAMDIEKQESLNVNYLFWVYLYRQFNKILIIFRKSKRSKITL